MSKQKKKRNKPYTGAGSNAVRPQTIRVEAVQRNKAQLWWHDRKHVLKPALIAAAVVIILGYLLYELFRLIFVGV
ncbi:hypothetical protein GII36_04560 [Candidatus Mycosynbacter amalyticus]|uniref:Uncharacterized protein n=1 Tax=Candidatus Mycosynbacter amalyticus TaxID=2665156 RepID=A0A857MPC5_9BACT|nr:hypothetical protein [Candidatus Mycosynbacter amalyticus]QHN43099.1 hypothetical protein GII36_04560 [Candidatus Mycosynbacter amalyticus]